MWRIFRDARILGAIGLGLFLGVIAILNATVYSPEATVMRYLSALEDGRQADVEEIVWGDSVSLAYDIVVPADPADRPLHPSIVEKFRAADTVLITARVELGGKKMNVEFALTKEPSWSPLTSWNFSLRPVGIIDVVSTAESGASVNGAAGSKGSLVYYPSIATVAAPSPWFDTRPQKVLVDTLGRDYTVSLDLTPSTTLHKDIDVAVREYIDDCAAQKTLVPKKCPFAGFTAMAIADGPTWTIDTYPTVSIVEKNGQWHVSGDGKVRLKVSLVDFATEKTEKYSEKMSFTISATLLITDGAKPRLIFDNTVER